MLKMMYTSPFMPVNIYDSKGFLLCVILLLSWLDGNAFQQPEL